MSLRRPRNQAREHVAFSAAEGPGVRRAQLAALRRLARRDHATQELRRALLRAGHDVADVDQAIERLRERRLIDDGAYAERFAREALRGKGWGSRRIAARLRMRGVRGDTIDAGLREALEIHPEAEALDDVARRWWRRRSRVTPDQRVPRLWGFLLRRGFPPDLVRSRLRELLPELAGEISQLHDPYDEGGL